MVVGRAIMSVIYFVSFFFFFFKQKTAYEIVSGDWSSDVCSSDLDGRGAPVAWSHRLVGPEGGSFLLTRGADELIYPVPHFRLERVIEDPGVPVAPWRGVGPSQNGWVVESFVDELAHAAGKDPYAYRRELVAGHPRLVGRLDLAAEHAAGG